LERVGSISLRLYSLNRRTLLRFSIDFSFSGGVKELRKFCKQLICSDKDHRIGNCIQVGPECAKYVVASLVTIEVRCESTLKNMKKLAFILACASALALSVSTHAVAINIYGTGDFPAQDIESVTGNPGLGQANVLAWLQSETDRLGFPMPTVGISDYTGGPIEAGDYLVLHYGAGNGGTPAGGLVALYFDAAQASFAVPATGSGPNRFGGLSFARLYDHVPPVPDQGMTVALLGMGISGLAFIRRFVKSA
jgi:hypothetical protein